MLDQETVLKRAITWQALGEWLVLTKNHTKSAYPFSKASAYMDVLDLPHSRQCGVECIENLTAYAKQLAEEFLRSGDSDLNQFLDESINLNYYANYD